MRPALLLLACLTFAQAQTVEEARLQQVATRLPALNTAFAGLTRDFAHDWANSRDALEATRVAREYGRKLWLGAKARLHEQGDFDDRPLYWARLALTSIIRDNKPAFPLFEADRAAAIAALEQSSRGMDEIRYDPDRKIKRILLTGFDPFALERNLDQSNPSGVTALLLDGEEIVVNGERARVEVAVFPVRYADFDAGMVEDFLTPWMAGPRALATWQAAAGKLPAGVEPQVDMVVTVSMGREQFDLERYPGLRRSAKATDNLAALSGGSRTAPVIPLLHGLPLVGPEFVEFSLPVAAMQTANGPYKVQDNRWVRVMPDTRMAAGGLAALHGKTAVEGGGGGYLSNEISYRSVRLRNQLGLAQLPVGHIHTPSIQAFEPAKTADITKQVREMLKAAIKTL
ncbi:hypothetical protein GCM10007907_36780 [Chitinimonas prasina]|uniref:Pyroglutamyl peptidase n=1 Tax=Chitinimonas prasina TaxID=1434937 RepID=A0ABQ5YMG9_9NEIS|nr:hypothetical protein [Chitinimonas prasina]GLR14888.1 hypothetical protein GCM10007907_36780 [Chitinimonas prasina]